MAAGYNINQAINPPMPGPASYRAAHTMQSGFASMIETRMGGWMSLLYRSNSLEGGLTHFVNFGGFFNDGFAVVPQGVGFITRRTLNVAFQFGTNNSSSGGGGFTAFMQRNGSTGGQLLAGKYYLFPIENVSANATVDETDIGGAGSWPMTDHQWFLNNNTTANIPYSRGFEHKVMHSNDDTGLPAAGTFTPGNLRLNINQPTGFQDDDFLLIDMYGMCIRRT